MKHLPKRKNSLRRAGYDYSSEGAYFVTICTYKRTHIFGTIVDDIMQLSQLGTIAESCWHEIPQHYPSVELDAYVVMPNHMHGIVILRDSEKRPLLGRVVGRYKGAVTRLGKRAELDIDLDYPVWQRGFHDRIIRNKSEYDTILAYVHNNPKLWGKDMYYE